MQHSSESPHRISVCMATYNGEKHILRQLKSIISQIDEDDEIIISDDGSIDKTLAIIESLNEKRIRITLNDGLSGPLGNFEHALMQATGDFILLSDQDDIWLPDKVSVMRSLLQYNDLVLSDCIVVNENTKVIHSSFFKHRGSRLGFLPNLYKNSYVGCCMGFRREVLSYALPFPSEIHMHDWWIGLLVEIKGKSCLYPKPLIQYVRHGENASPTGEAGYSLPKRLINRLTLLWFLLKRLTL